MTSLAEAEVDRLRRRLGDRAGLRFDGSRLGALVCAVGERLDALQEVDADRYVTLVEEDDSELDELLELVTVGETHFFRNPPQVQALAGHVLPDLLRQALATTGRVRIWSAGCSTGEEPYTVAMLLREAVAAVPGAETLDISVVGTDISSRVLALAAAARYGERALADMDPVRRHAGFVRDGHEWVVRDEVRAMVSFRRHNLAGDLPPLPRGERLDLVLCRNVTIYFDRETTRALMGRLHRSLRDGGFLFLGHSETLWQLSEDFRLVTLGDAYVYRRDDGPAGERRRVLPERRSLPEPSPVAVAAAPPLPAERRRGGRRLNDLVRRRAAQPTLAELVAAPVPAPRTRPAPVLVGAGRGPDPATLVQATAERAAGQARAALSRASYREAVELLDEALEDAPTLAELHYLRGRALADLGEAEAAVRSLRTATSLDPGHGLAWFSLAGQLSRAGRPRPARAAYRNAATRLGCRPGDAASPELGGRAVADIVRLCRTLAAAD